MPIADRILIYEAIEKHRKRPLIAYVTSKREGVAAEMATDVLPYLIEQLDAIPADAEKLDFLIVSLGGDPMVAWRIMSLIRERISFVSVLIPQSAFSAATLLALGADEIYVHPNGHLGPIDMQVNIATSTGRRNFSTEDIAAFVEFVRKDLAITDQEHLRHLFEATCREVGSIGVGFNARSQKLAVSLAERLLEMPNKGKEAESATIRTIVKSLSTHFHSHSYPVSRSEAIKMKLPVNEERDPDLEKLMWALWRDLEGEMKEREPFNPIAAVLESPSGLPLLDLSQTEKSVAITQPIDFEVVSAILESSRRSFFGLSRGKLLAARMPDLNVQYNCLSIFQGWEERSPKP